MELLDHGLERARLPLELRHSMNGVLAAGRPFRGVGI
jgi:hypothetical protein